MVVLAVGAAAICTAAPAAGQSERATVLLPLPAGSGITPIETVTSVDLREGRFNITAVLAEDPSADEGTETSDDDPETDEGAETSDDDPETDEGTET